MRALLCAAAVCAGILQTGAAYPEGLEPVQQGITQEAASLIPVTSLWNLAEDYDIDEDFLREIADLDGLTQRELTSLAVEYQLPAQYVQRFVDNMFVFKKGNGYEYIPVDPSLRKNSYDWDYLKDSSRDKRYDDGLFTGIKMIDVSAFQGDINWNAVKNDGVNYAFIRLGYRGYTEGKLHVDSKFHQNMRGAANAGVQVGVYFYSQAVSRAEAIEEAEFVLDHLGDYQLSLPIVFDIEGAQTTAYRTYRMGVQTATNIVKAFCDTIRSAGYDSMYYSYSKFLIENLDMAQLEGYPLWMAQYYQVPFFPYDFKIWQYSPKGRVAGIPNSVDLNLFFYDYSQA